MPSCATCGKEGSKKCTGCSTVYYCSVECQKSDWPNHKPNCFKRYAFPENMKSCSVCNGRSANPDFVKENGKCDHCTNFA